MRQVKAGELKLLAVLFERYHRRLFTFFVRMNNDGNLSEDLTQMVFERIIRYRNSYKDEANFKTWIFQIGRNVYRDHFRLNKFQVETEVDVQQILFIDEGDEDQEVLVQRKRRLKTAIASLKPEYREVLILGWLENLKYAEVATVIGISEANVKVRMHRAIKQLKRQMVG